MGNCCWRYIEQFQFVFQRGLRCFPQKEGVLLLFRKNDECEAPYTGACKEKGTKETLKAIENTLIKCSDRPYNTAAALLSAAVDESIILDGVNFLLRREPDVLQKLLSGTAVNNNNDGPSNKDGVNMDNSTATAGKRKRKYIE